MSKGTRAARMEEKLNKLAKLYEEMHLCLRCINSPNRKIVNDLKKVMRIVEKRATASKVFLVGQALGEQTQRISGRPYTKANGKLSNTGHNLEKFLRLFGYTIDSADCRMTCPPKRSPVLMLDWKLRKGENHGQENLFARANHQQTTRS